MSETKEEKLNCECGNIESTLSRIGELNKTRESLEQKRIEIETHENDLSTLEKIRGVESTEYVLKKEMLDSTREDFEKIQSMVNELSFKKSELKDILDSLAKKFEEELRGEQEREYHIEIGVTTEDGKQTGRKAYKQLMEYLNHNVNWTAKTAPALMMLVRNMKENAAWVQSKEFDNVIILRSANVLALWKYILEEMTGTGYFEAKAFMECWANCGKSISDTIREIQKMHENTRLIGSQLTTVEDEYNKSEDDMPKDETLNIKDEVDPDVD